MDNIELRNEYGLTESEFLKLYKPGDYDRPSMTVDMLLFTVDDVKIDNTRQLPDKELKVLLIKRKDHPYIGKWAFPGGFVDIDECINDAVYRELKEETNIENVYMEQLGTYGNVDRDPRMRVVSVAHMALVSKDNLKPEAGDDAEEVAWFSVKKELIIDDEDNTVWHLLLENRERDIKIGYEVIDTKIKNGIIYTTNSEIKPLDWSYEQLAFDHYKILNDGIDRLKNKVIYTDIAFNLMPEYFTITQLQKVYEAILNKRLIASNFRRDIKSKIINTDILQPSVEHRPAKLFKYNNKHKKEV